MRAQNHPDEAARLQAVQRYEPEDEGYDAGLMELVAYAARVCDAPVSLVSTVEANRQTFRAEVGFGKSETTREESFCAHAILDDGLFEVADATLDPRFADNPLVTGETHVRFYAGVPLRSSEGLPLGSFCVLDTKPRELSDFQRETLILLARQAEARLELIRKGHELEAERAKAEAARAFLGLVTDRLPVRVAYIDREFRFRFMNDAYERETGVSRAAALGQTVAEAMGDAAFESVRANLARALAGESHTQEFAIDYPAGRRIVQASYVPDRAAGGAVQGVVVQVLDLTDLRRSESALAEQRTRQDRTLETAGVATFEWDVRRDRLRGNSLLRLFYNLPDDPEGSPIDAFYAAMHPDDRAVRGEAIGGSLRAGIRYEAEYRVTGFDGRERRVLARGDVTLDAEGKPWRVSGIVLDVTERILAEQALRESERKSREAFALLADITEGTQDLIVSIDREYRFTSVNVAYRRDFERVFGTEPRVGESMRDALADLPGEWANAKAMFDRALAGEKVDVTAEFGDPGRVRRVFDLRFYPLCNEAGEVTGAGETARDVTERAVQEAERERLLAELEIEQAKLRTIFAQAPAIIAVLAGHDLVFDYVNEAYYATVGHRPLIGLRLEDAIPEAVGGGEGRDYERVLRHVLDTGERLTYTERPVVLQPTSGGPLEERFLDLAYLPLREVDGTISGVLAHGIDVTEGVLARKVIAEREELFRTVFEQAPDDAILVMDRNRILTAWNPAAERMTGWSAAEAIGQAGDLIFTPEDRSHDMPARESENAALNGKAVDERWHMRRDGSRFWGSGTMNSLHDAEGAVRGFLKVFRDATARHTEAATLAFLRRLTDSILDVRDPDAIVETGERMLGEHLGVNRALLAEFSPSGDEFTVKVDWTQGVASLKGTHRLATFGSRIERNLRAGLIDVIRDASMEFTVEDGLLGLQGGECRAAITVPVRRDGQMVGVFAVNALEPRDWTEDEIGLVRQVADRMAAEVERARAEASLREANRTLEVRVEDRTVELREAVREAEAFNYSISHDLRTPLRAMVSTSSILLEDLGGKLDEEHRELLERQAHNAKRLGKLIDELLRLSRLARATVNRQPFDLSAAAQAEFDDLQNHERTNGCRFEVTPNLVALGDPGLTRTVLQNLIGNACKFSPRGGTVRVGRANGVFYVRDEGVGFDMAHAKRMFLPFERLVAEGEFEGTGIGLANVERIVRRHGGKVWAESHPGDGATFWFTLEPA